MILSRGQEELEMAFSLAFLDFAPRDSVHVVDVDTPQGRKGSHAIFKQEPLLVMRPHRHLSRPQG